MIVMSPLWQRRMAARPTADGAREALDGLGDGRGAVLGAALQRERC
jgi:hypothetical protein